eukprot:CAMPEP_0171989626 /NCGR_PEP_ID=MMETSP0993-20121228/276509_1 /TAXON_ID=483369 /ORGANISM="non described non described, Strain CCMP2098" /LENGTH=453 /DNA_ID=CAMNT_0012642619 /DNA_START=38 /DNA_END=1401 /DNA_ORIENTATION=-
MSLAPGALFLRSIPPLSPRLPLSSLSSRLARIGAQASFSTSQGIDTGRVAPAGRIAKVMAKSDLGVSRREAERLIEEKRVWHNGEVISKPGIVAVEGDIIKVNGKPLTFFGAKSAQMYVAHKLPGELVTDVDPLGRPTLKERLKQGKGLRKLMGQLCFVGRLDFNSEGLILLTNDGDLARRMEQPSSLLQRTYRVRVHGSVPPWKLAALGRGMTVEGVRYKPMTAVVEASTPAQMKAAAGRVKAAAKAAAEGGRPASPSPSTSAAKGMAKGSGKGEDGTLLAAAKMKAAAGRVKAAAKAAAEGGRPASPSTSSAAKGSGKGEDRDLARGGEGTQAVARSAPSKSTNSWIRITCHEGKNRQIRKVCKALGLEVSRLVRVSFGPYTLGGCDRGALLKVDGKKALEMLDSLSKEAGGKEAANGDGLGVNGGAAAAAVDMQGAGEEGAALPTGGLFL